MTITGVAVELHGVKFMNGDAHAGAAIRAQQSILTVHDGIFKSNKASGWLGYGGAIAVTGKSSAKFYSTTFDDNKTQSGMLDTCHNSHRHCHIFGKHLHFRQLAI